VEFELRVTLPFSWGKCSITWATPPAQTQSSIKSINSLKIQVFFTLSVQSDSPLRNRHFESYFGIPHFGERAWYGSTGVQTQNLKVGRLTLPLEPYPKLFKKIFFTYFMFFPGRPGPQSSTYTNHRTRGTAGYSCGDTWLINWDWVLVTLCPGWHQTTILQPPPPK
jgi:hypothetical protein